VVNTVQPPLPASGRSGRRQGAIRVFADPAKHPLRPQMEPTIATFCRRKASTGLVCASWDAALADRASIYNIGGRNQFPAAPPAI